MFFLTFCLQACGYCVTDNYVFANETWPHNWAENEQIRDMARAVGRQ
jgi:hypothetical protein